ncbi:hypothetical protein JCM11641_005087 [Rhodosporidiobolus odoratus]
MRVHTEETAGAVLLEDEGYFFSLFPSSQGIAARLLAPGQGNPPFDAFKGYEVTGCIGLLDYGGVTWLLACKSSPPRNLETLDDVLFFSIPPSTHSPQASSPFHPCHHLWKVLTAGHFHFSRRIDLSTRLANRAKVQNHRSNACMPTSRQDPTPPLMPPPHADGTEDFVWNSALLAPLHKLREQLSPKELAAFDDRSFAVSLLHGYSRCDSIDIDGKMYLVQVESRCGWRRAGVLGLRQGIDDEGTVAEFVETETIVSDGKKHVSFVQLRGDFPISYHTIGGTFGPQHWFSTRIVAPTPFETFSVPPFLLHFRHLISSYSAPVRILSTVDHPDGTASDYEAVLALAQVQDQSLVKTVKWHETGVNNASMFGGSIAQVADELEVCVRSGTAKMGLTVVSVAEKGAGMVLEKEQKGVWRVNSDMQLDRTSLAAWQISTRALLAAFEELGISSDLEKAGIAKVHDKLFADNCDTISLIYSGSKTMCGSFIRTGRASFLLAVERGLSYEKRQAKRAFEGQETEKAVEALTGQLKGQIQPILTRVT